MFSGIIEQKSSVVGLHSYAQATRLSVNNIFESLKLGESIAVNGVCLTVVEFSHNHIQFDLAQETLRRTTLGNVSNGDFVNLERALRADSRIDGHLLTGHIDTTVSLLERSLEHNSERYIWQLPDNLAGLIAEKGCVALDGVSLTVGEVSDKSFAVYIIPHTAKLTTLSDRRVGEHVNLEVDIIARYVHRSLAYMGSK